MRVAVGDGFDRGDVWHGGESVDLIDYLEWRRAVTTHRNPPGFGGGGTHGPGKVPGSGARPAIHCRSLFAGKRLIFIIKDCASACDLLASETGPPPCTPG
jgi:hypothetical protein